MRLETIPVGEAVGRVLGHDVTRIVAGEIKAPLFRKGHVIAPEDLDALRLAGKEQIFILTLEPGDVHEDDAAIRLGRAAAGPGITLAGPVESRVNLVATVKGLLKVHVPLLAELNALPDCVFATLPTNTVVQAGEVVAGTKVIPLTVKESLLRQAEAIMARGTLVEVRRLPRRRVGLIITGREVFTGRVRESFAPVLTQKVQQLGSEVVDVDLVPDDAGEILGLIRHHAASGSELILVTGGMSVDPDDVTPAAIAASGAEVIQYGAPVLPGAMFMLAYLGDVPVAGVPACGLFYRATVLDLLLPRLLAGERITRRDVVGLGHGGLCRRCEACRFPACSFGAASPSESALKRGASSETSTGDGARPEVGP